MWGGGTAWVASGAPRSYMTHRGGDPRGTARCNGSLYRERRRGGRQYCAAGEHARGHRADASASTRRDVPARADRQPLVWSEVDPAAADQTVLAAGRSEGPLDGVPLLGRRAVLDVREDANRPSDGGGLNT